MRTAANARTAARVAVGAAALVGCVTVQAVQAGQAAQAAQAAKTPRAPQQVKAEHAPTAPQTPAHDTVTPAALADLGLALLRQPGGPNAVVSPLATATALGMLHAGLNGPAEREIEALFAPRGAAAAPATAASTATSTAAGGLKTRLPALLKAVQAGPDGRTAPAPFVMAGRVWINEADAAHVPAGYTQRLATRYGADAARLPFNDSETARGRINAWTAQHTAGRIAELLPTGSVAPATKIVLTSAIHFRSAWDKPFDAAVTEARSFGAVPAAAHAAPGVAASAGGTAGTSASTSATPTTQVPTLLDERSVWQASVDGTQVYALPFASKAYALLLVVPAAASDVTALLRSMRGADIARWQAALQPQRCALALPKFNIAPQALALKPALQQLGVQTVFTTAADLRPMLGHSARGMHLDDVHHAAGITIDEQGGEAVAAAAATVQAKSLRVPAPPCAVDRPFVFAVLHLPTGTPLFMGRVAEPALKD